MTDQFIPSAAAWISSHYFDVPNEVVEFCGSIAGATILNLGCGEMLTDFGLLGKEVKSIAGLDLHERPSSHIESVAQKLRTHGIIPPDDYQSRLSYVHYGGTDFPFEDGQFDVVFSWSAFEHIHDVPSVLSEVRRVLRNDGFAFVQVYPWYHSFQGSHLIDFIPEPYFHLTRPPEWVRQRLEEYVAAHPEERDRVLGYMFGEYSHLNCYSADRFYSDVVAAGFYATKARLITYDLNLSSIPRHTRFSEAMICGSKMLLRKNMRFKAEPAE